MAKIYIALGTVFGNAEKVAIQAENLLKAAGHEVSFPINCEANAVAESDLLLVICSTTGQGDLPAEISDFYQGLPGISAQWRQPQVAFVGLGDSSYQDYCGAIEHFERQAEDLGWPLALETLKIDATQDYEPEPVALPWLQQLIDNLANA